ncbi:ArnT family glycosyltransferase [Patulibacter americanus]|uniref:ArnT family glycosyltransferase n=1 Tax=Patulibacter americanus TaxID=588672 RepID=UPI0003B3EAC9|nr:glycosyltransferase family 39 protein [Patulibacter americanus]
MPDATPAPTGDPETPRSGRPAARRGGSRRDPSRRGARTGRVRRSLAGLPGWELALVGAIVLVALVLRFWNLGQNLPLVYNIDESARFVPDAATVFSQRLGYRELVNPPGMMGLLGVLQQLWFRPQGLSPSEALVRDPGEAYLLGRVVVALLSVAAVPVLYAAARQLTGRTAALVAAGLLAVAFLPVAYARVALADGPTLLFVALGLLGAAWILQDDAGRRRGFLLAGVAVGLAAGFKYNAGIVVLVALAAAVLRVRPDGFGTVARRTVLMGVVALAAFVLSNPYVLIDPHEVLRAIEYQANWSGSGRYVGEPMTNGFVFYTWAAGWGVGWAPLVAAVVGSLLLAVRRPRIALLLLPMVAGYLVVMGFQDRFFARWLLPIVPVLVIAAGYAVQEVVGLLARRPRRVRIALAGALALGLGAQSLLHSTHTAAVVGREDTRTVLRDWMVAHVPPKSGVVLESMSPGAWMPTFDGNNAYFSLNRWSIYHTIAAVQRRDRRKHPQLRLKAGFSSWVRILYPELIDEFERYGYCTVVTSSYQAGRAGRTPELVPAARRYYRELTRRADLVWQLSPFSREATFPDGRGPWLPTTAPVKYQIDRQATTYELDYERPGPMVSVYRLRGGRCAGTPPGAMPAVVPNAPWR